VRSPHLQPGRGGRTLTQGAFCTKLATAGAAAVTAAISGRCEGSRKGVTSGVEEEGSRENGCSLFDVGLVAVVNARGALHWGQRLRALQCSGAAQELPREGLAEQGRGEGQRGRGLRREEPWHAILGPRGMEMEPRVRRGAPSFVAHASEADSDIGIVNDRVAGNPRAGAEHGEHELVTMSVSLLTVAADCEMLLCDGEGMYQFGTTKAVSPNSV